MTLPMKKLTRQMLALGVGLSASTTLYAQTTPLWSDEFDGATINSDVWSYTTGGSGFGNGELQYYTASHKNAYIENGNLVIEARREEHDGKMFTSSRLHTNGRLSFRYGTLEARIKLPDLANGLWPAFWMMGTNFGIDGWPKSGEWDILEAGYKEAIDNGTVNSSVSGAMHWWHEAGTWGDWLQADAHASTQVTPALHEAYHTYKLEWTPTDVTISVDDNAYFTMDITDPNMSEFRDNPAFIILNMAVGGHNFVQITDPAQITAPFPAKMYVDYVRLYPNEYTELNVAADNLRSGNFGVSTETTPVMDELNWGDRTNLYVWNNMTSVATTPSEGTSALAYDIAAGDWWGMGLLHKDHNMENYKHGYLHVDVKTTSTEPFSIGIASTSAGSASVQLAPGGEEYGLARDGEWHTVSIPLNKFGNVDFGTINTFFNMSGPAPAQAMSIAVDNIYWSESIKLPAPEMGAFGIYTETPANMTAANFGFGVDGDLFLWDNTLQLTSGDVVEGSSALNLQSTGAGWYGMGLTARNGFNLTAFDNANAALHFSMKTTDQSDFQIGMKSGNVNDIGQWWLKFQAGNDPYGFTRDGQWHEIVIPMSDIAKDLDLFDVRQVFQLLGTGEIADLSIDNIYITGGELAKDPGNNGPVINRAPTAAIKPSVTGGAAPLDVSFDASQSGDVNGDTLTYTWNFGDGTTATGVNANHTFTEEGSYAVTLTVNDGEISTSVSRTIFADAEHNQTKSDKRGLGYGHHSEADLAAISEGISWWYNWSHAPDLMIQDVYQNYGVEFAPMAWNGAFDEQGMRDYIAAHPEVKYILAFNEPNFIEQANMTPSEAAAQWPRLEAIAAEFNLKIVSVAMNFCGHCVTENGTTYYDPIDYFDDFFAACPDCQVDAISIHAYMPDISGIEWYIDLFKKYNRPIWMTEFSAWEDTTTLESQKKLLIHAVDSMENDPDVQRYAWFTGRRNGHPYNGLFDYRQSGILTELGDIYVNMPVHGPGNVHALPSLVEAEEYGQMNGVRLELTEDDTGFLNISEVAPGDWVEYNVTGTAGDYAVTARVAAEVEGTIDVWVNGVLQSTVNVPASGGLQSWQTVDINLALQSTGAHTLRLVFNGTMNLNWLKVADASSDPVDPTDPAPAGNLALGQPAIASSQEAGAMSASEAVDGNIGTRWASSWNDAEWLYVDLGQVFNINRVVLNWEAAYGKGYEIQVSDDASAWTTIFSTTNGDGGLDDVSVAGSGRYVRMLGTQRGTGYGYSLWELEVYGSDNDTTNPDPTPGTDKALNKPASTSSNEGAMNGAAAVDGNSGTRWASNWTDSEWITVDLGSHQNISRVVLNWEAAYGKGYDIQVSDDANTWTTLYSTTTGDGGTDDITVSGSGRYLRMLGTQRGTGYGYSLWDLEVY